MGLLAKLFGKKSEQKKQPTKVHAPVKPESSWEPATVKKPLTAQNGFGFLSRGEGKKDIYVHFSTLQRCRIRELKKGQNVDVKWGTTPKGLEAAELRLSK